MVGDGHDSAAVGSVASVLTVVSLFRRAREGRPEVASTLPKFLVGRSCECRCQASEPLVVGSWIRCRALFWRRV